MELEEISLAELLNSTSGTEYFATFAKLIGKSKDAIFFDGIDDDSDYLLEELENELGYELPSHYLDFLGYLNGGKFLNMDLFSLADKEYPNSLYGRNFLSNIRKEIDIEDSSLIIGKYNSYIMCVGCGEDDSYALMDIRNNEIIKFETFNALVGFIFYVLVVNEGKKVQEEKKYILDMKEKIHKEIKDKESLRKKEKEKKKNKLMAKSAVRALSAKQKNIKR